MIIAARNAVTGTATGGQHALDLATRREMRAQVLADSPSPPR